MVILDDSLPKQLEHAAGPLADVSITWTGTDPDALVAHCRRQRPHVAIVNVDLLGPGLQPDRRIAALKEETGAELVIALYTFLRRDDLEALTSVSRPLRGPVSLARLRSQMLSVIVRHMLDDDDTAKSPPPVEVGPPRFSSAQLARLMEIQSAVDCECPNHLSELVSSLSAFEAYARNCENRSPADAKIHADLALFTAQARAIMERALERIIEHEKIVL